MEKSSKPATPVRGATGDLMIFDGKEWVFPGIYLGSNNVLFAFEKGVMVVPFRMFKHALVGIRRLSVSYPACFRAL